MILSRDRVQLASRQGIIADRPARLQRGSGIGQANGVSVVTREVVHLLTTHLRGCDCADSLSMQSLCLHLMYFPLAAYRQFILVSLSVRQRITAALLHAISVPGAAATSPVREAPHR